MSTTLQGPGEGRFNAYGTESDRSALEVQGHALVTTNNIEARALRNLRRSEGGLTTGIVYETIQGSEQRAPTRDREVPLVERTDVMEKVKALWAKGDDPGCTPAEAATFRDAAARLMAKYEIEQFELAAATGTEAAIIRGLFKIDAADKPMMLSDERMLLAGAIARHFECRGIIKDFPYGTADPETGEAIKGGTYYECIGYKHDFEMVRELYFSLVVDLLAGVFGEQQTNRNYQQEYARGFVARIDDRLKEFYKRVNDWVDDGTVSDSTALAIRSRLQNVQDKVTELYPKLNTVKIKSTKFDPNARQRGKARADMSDIGGHNKVAGGASKGIGQAKKELGS